jgi:hypothetical protein
MTKPLNVRFDRRTFLGSAALLVGSRPLAATANAAALSEAITPQPYFATVGRAMVALAAGGQPLAASDAAAIARLKERGDSSAVMEAEAILHRYTLVSVTMEPDGYPSAKLGGAAPILHEQGWSLFLVRVSNLIGATGSLEVSTGVLSPITRSTNAQKPHLGRTLNRAPALAQAWLAAELYAEPPATPVLSGASVEYFIVQLFARDRGLKRAYLNFTAGGDSWVKRLDLAHRGVELSFDCRPSREVRLGILDHDGESCVASLTFRDRRGRIYPLQAMRIAPDLPFQPHIYRADGESVRLPDGAYEVESWRGPEYHRQRRTIFVSASRTRLSLRLERWIDPAKHGWYSGDTHIHAAGCAHYSSPTEGISPETVIRHVRGEGLALGNVLTWGPGWYYQRQFFSGHSISPEAVLEHPELQVANQTSLKPKPTAKDEESLLRYDVEVSGFPSSHSGHLVLLRLKEQDYPGTSAIEEWPSWNLPILQWAKSRGAIVGYAHCGERMAVGTSDLPNYVIPPMDGVGANEAIIDVTHGAVDFLSGGEWLPTNELNTWYHMLNCGFRLPMVGETDFPCLSADRPGSGRSYVKLPRRPKGDAGYGAWVEAMKDGRLYFGEGRSHFLDWTVNGRRAGEGQVTLGAGVPVKVEAMVAAWIEPKPTAESERIRLLAPFAFPQWHLERARIGEGREVPVELVVNGEPVARTALLADGKPRRIGFDIKIDQSAWIALRILPSGHTAPLYVSVADRPVRASRKSAEWLLACVERLWEIKSPHIREGERQAAARAYDHARRTYRVMIVESL